MEFTVGSPEWFNDKAKTFELKQFKNETEELRRKFIEKYTPEKLKQMNGKDLLQTVFGNGNAMVNILLYDSTYRRFGAPGEYRYLGIVYFSEADESWRYKEGKNAYSITESEAEYKAEKVRDQLLECVSVIENHEFNSIHDYEALDSELSKVFFSKYPWVIKYYQMIFPQYFPGMYADVTIDRALSILGLPSHGKGKRIVNAGEIALFIRRCDINNIVFGHIYGSFWGWDDKNIKACPNAAENNDNRNKIPPRINLDYYELSGEDNDNDEFLEIERIDNNIEELQIYGKEKSILIKTRVNQGIFRKKLLNRYGKCCICGVSDDAFLVASHIKPWSVSDASEKLDQDNGFLLCPNHDQLFDQGYISFDEEGKILISELLKQNDRTFMNVNDSMHIVVNQGNRKYLKYHRENVFKK